MKIAVIDDEAPIRAAVISLVKTFYPAGEIIGEADTVPAGVELIKATQPDLVLLDIDLKGTHSFELLAQFPKAFFKVIFITGFNEYAIKAFRFNAVDYLLKPVDPDELVEALEKAAVDLRKEAVQEEFSSLIQQIKRKEGSPDTLILKNSDSIFRVKVSDIIRVAAEGGYSTFYLASGKEILVSKTIKEYDELLSDCGFFRIHQSHLINLSFFERFDKKEGGYIVMTDGAELPLAQRKRDKLFTALGV